MKENMKVCCYQRLVLLFNYVVSYKNILHLYGKIKGIVQRLFTFLQRIRREDCYYSHMYPLNAQLQPRD